jgi:hypothetical protein
MVNLYYPFTKNDYLGSNPKNKWLTKSHLYTQPTRDPKQSPRFPFISSFPRPWRNHSLTTARRPPLTGTAPHPPDSRANTVSPHLHPRIPLADPPAGRPGRRGSGGTAPAGPRRTIQQPRTSLIVPYAVPSGPSASPSPNTSRCEEAGGEDCAAACAPAAPPSDRPPATLLRLPSAPPSPSPASRRALLRRPQALPRFQK